MKRIGRALGKRLTYANIVATLALFVALGGTATAAVMITSNSQVASSTISGHQPPSGKHANVIAGSVNANDLSGGLKTSLKVHCPNSLQNAGDLCFDASPRKAALWLSALSTCANAGLRLPTIGELREILDHTGAPQPLEWSDALYDEGGTYFGTAIDDDSSRQLDYTGATIDNALQFRCVATPSN